jgi:hypothetical protein
LVVVSVVVVVLMVVVVFVVVLMKYRCIGGRSGRSGNWYRCRSNGCGGNWYRCYRCRSGSSLVTGRDKGSTSSQVIEVSWKSTARKVSGVGGQSIEVSSWSISGKSRGSVGFEGPKVISTRCR